MAYGQALYKLRDGKIAIYTLPEDKHGTWQCRFKIAGKYVRRSTKTTNVHEAKQVAQDLYDELRYRQKNDRPLKDRTFREVAKGFVKKREHDVIEGKIGKGRLDVINGTLKRYLLAFFGDRLITDLERADFDYYDEWRANYWKTGPGAQKRKPRKTDKIAAKTLVVEQGILIQIMRYALENNYIKRLPVIEKKKAKTNRRSAFTAAEYLKMIRLARKRIEEAEHTRVKRERQQLEIYIRLLVGAGIRVGEARKLTWNDIEVLTVGDGRKTLRLWVDGKTGKRAVIGTVQALKAIEKLLTLSGFETLDEAKEQGNWLFIARHGKRTHTFEVGFKALVQAAKLDKDRYGENRTLYSLRHTYATFRLQYRGTDVYLLAKNMGTSVAMIEGHYGHVNVTLAADRLL